ACVRIVFCFKPLDFSAAISCSCRCASRQMISTGSNLSCIQMKTFVYTDCGLVNLSLARQPEGAGAISSKGDINMKSAFKALAISALGGLSLAAGSSGAHAADGDTLAAIKQRGEVICGTYPSRPGFA